jgi:hypothetical protein
MIIFYDDNLMPYFKQDDVSVGYATTEAFFRDTSAWYHIVVALDVTQSEDSIDIAGFSPNVIRTYVNGVLQTKFINYHLHNGNNETPPFSTTGTLFNTQKRHMIGRKGDGQDWYFNGYMANVQFIDGAALNPSYFGETFEGNWIHRPYDGTSTVEGATPVSGLSGNDIYGTNGFYLNFADESNLGKDVSGNGNDWT